MQGAALREQRRHEADIALAWNGEKFAREKTLRELGYYLKKLKPKRPQTAADIIEVFEEYRRRGAPISIRRIQPGEA